MKHPAAPSNNSFGAFTIVAKNYLPYAMVLAESFLDCNPGCEFTCVVVDEIVPPFELAQSEVNFIGVEQLSRFVDDFWLMATMYDVTEFSTALKPFVLEKLLDSYLAVMYIDPDIKVYGSLVDLFEKSTKDGWVLTPHCLDPMRRDGLTPSEADIMQSGIYNLGFIGVSASATPMLKWWQERLLRDAISDPARQLFTDQRWIDLAVAAFHPAVEQSTAYNVAYWNLDQRVLKLEGDRVLVDDNPLKFFHFSGFNPKTPWWLSKHHPTHPRNLVSSSTALEYLCEDYAAHVLSKQEHMGLQTPYRWNQVIPGFTLERSLRRYFREECLLADKGEVEYPPNPFSDGPTKFLQWLEDERIAGGIPRYADVALSSRHDLQLEFGEARTREQSDHLIQWLSTTGCAEIPWLTFFVDHIKNASSQPEEVRDKPSFLMEPAREGVDIVGYLRSEHGVGEAGRLLLTALQAADVEVSTVTSSRSLSRQRIDHDDGPKPDHNVRILAINADQTAIVASDVGLDQLENSYVIGQWFWEIECFPDHWNEAFSIVDEVWTATDFVANAVREVAPRNVVVNTMPIPLTRTSTGSDLTRAHYGIDDRFLFLFSFDMLSIYLRKNPAAVVEAFTGAFSEDDGCQLVVKCMNGDKDLNSLEHLRWLARSRPDIRIIDEYYTREEAANLIDLADCYVSLHRSEGLGLTMAEAMCAGVPVIATGYSGNVDFMNSSNSLLVPWNYVTVGEGSRPYDPASRWAEPNVEMASEYMRWVVSHNEEAKELAQNAKAHLHERFDPVTCGLRMKARLSEIWKEIGK